MTMALTHLQKGLLRRADAICGVKFDPAMKDEVKISLIAAGIN